jgi:hypothetical protein
MRENYGYVFLVDDTECLIVCDVSIPQQTLVIGIDNVEHVPYCVDDMRKFIFITQLSHGFIIPQINPESVPSSLY